ncbi:MAG: hypothetical protein AAF957_25460 [Planctomycetota bacterium]
MSLTAVLPVAAAAALAMGRAPNDDVRAGAVEVEGQRIPYRLVVPAEIEPGRAYPLVLFLHGAGERGEDNETQLVHFPVRMLTPDRRASMPCFVLAPQCPGNDPSPRSSSGRSRGTAAPERSRASTRADKESSS